MKRDDCRYSPWRGRWALLAVLAWASPSAFVLAAGDEARVVGTRNSNVYHTRPCPHSLRISPERRVVFKSIAEAKADGRRQCKTCAAIEVRESDDAPDPEPAAERPKRSESNRRRTTPADRKEEATEPPPASAPSQAASTQPTRVRVAEVRDGDTLVLESGLMVRLIGISCPETGQDLGPEALQFAEQRVGAQEVSLETDAAYERRRHRDSWQRRLAYVRLANGSDLGEAILSAGLGWTEPRYQFERKTRYADAEESARRRQLGLWAPLPEPAGSAEVWLSSSGGTYHPPRCSHLRNTDSPPKSTVNAAKAAGLRPCTRVRSRGAADD